VRISAVVTTVDMSDVTQNTELLEREVTLMKAQRASADARHMQQAQRLTPRKVNGDHR
jgi:hypothetical protein